jgi:hypothetical protein
MFITTDTLRERRACAEQVELFASLFPDGVEVTEELCVKHAQDFGWDWASEYLLPRLAHEAYDEAVRPAYKAYNEAIRVAREAYIEATRPAREAYDEAVRPAYKAYDEAVRPAYKAYVEATRPARDAYIEAKARAFASAARMAGGER